MSDKKYELTDETIEVDGHTLYRIRALKDFKTLGFANIKAGDLGGFIQSEKNLSQDGDCWVAGDAKVFGSARILGNTSVYGHAKVFDNAVINGNSLVSGKAVVYENAVLDTVEVHGNAKIYGNADLGSDFYSDPKAWYYRGRPHINISGNSEIFGNAHLHGKITVRDYAKVYGDAHISGYVDVFEYAEIYDNADVRGSYYNPERSEDWGGHELSIRDNARIYGNSILRDNIRVAGNAEIYDNAYIHDKAYICDNAKVFGNADVGDDTWVNRARELCGDYKVEKEINDADKKYEITDEKNLPKEGCVYTPAYRIRALKDFVLADGTEIKAGDLGGFIQSEKNLSQEGNCWVADNAEVLDNARVSGDAYVYGNAVLQHSAHADENAHVGDFAKVSDCVRVYGNAKVIDNAQLHDTTLVYGNAYVHGNADVYAARSTYYNSYAYVGVSIYGDADVDYKIDGYSKRRIFENKAKTLNDESNHISNENSKYELVSTDSKFGLFTIRALKDFETIDGTKVHKGDLGGYVESENSLSQEGNCWVFEGSSVGADSRVQDNAIVRGFRVCGKSIIKDNAQLIDDERIAYVTFSHRQTLNVEDIDGPAISRSWDRSRKAIEQNYKRENYISDVYVNKILNDYVEDDKEARVISNSIFENNVRLIGHTYKEDTNKPHEFFEHVGNITIRNSHFSGNAKIDHVQLSVRDSEIKDNVCIYIIKNYHDLKISKSILSGEGNYPCDCKCHYTIWEREADDWVDYYVPAEQGASIINSKLTDKNIYLRNDNILNENPVYDVESVPKDNPDNEDKFTPKYELTDNTVTINGETLYQIKALFDFRAYAGTEVKAGDLGGYVKNTDVLSQDGTAWIGKGVAVISDKEIGSDVYISGDEKAERLGVVTFNNSEISDKVHIYATTGSTVDITDSTLADNASVYAKDGSDLKLDNVRMFNDSQVGCENHHKLQVVVTELYDNSIVNSITADMAINGQVFTSVQKIVDDTDYEIKSEPVGNTTSKSEPKDTPMFEPTSESKVVKTEDAKDTKDTNDKSKSNRVFINRISEGLIHNTKNKGIKVVSIPDKESASGYSNIFVKDRQVFQSTKRNGEPISGFNNVNLGSADRVLRYSVKQKDGSFDVQERSAREIVEIWNKNKYASMSKPKGVSNGAPEKENEGMEIE